MTALADALAAHCPPERPVRLVWPDQVSTTARGSAAGDSPRRRDWPSTRCPTGWSSPAELIADRDHLDEPGHYPESTSLKEEAFDPAEDIVSTFASYLMLYFDRWTHEGLRRGGQPLPDARRPAASARRARIEGDRMVEITPSGGGRRCPRLREALAAQDWRDETGAAAVTRLPRTIRLDASDAVVFAHAAEPGNGRCRARSCSGTRPADSLSRKEQIAFRSGFLGVESFGHSTLVVVQEARAEERAEMVEALARQLVAHLGAPSASTSPGRRPKRRSRWPRSLCRGHGIGTLIALHRRREGGEIREQFRTLRPRDETAFSATHLRGHDRAFQMVEERRRGPSSTS
jgi:hypothetical protein